MVEKENLLKELLNYLSQENKVEIDEYKFIGTGNPISDILIIGKEAAVSLNSEQYKTEILDNFDFWNNKYDSKKYSDLLNHYSPLYPYKGQLLKRDDKKGNNGTSVTWMNYQKLVNYIYNTPTNNKIDFHENSFITEVNSTPSKKTADANTSSIAFRKEHLLKSDFFQNFSIVIISGVGYFDISDDKNEIEDIFGVKFLEKKNASNKPRQPYWIHWNTEKTKLVINTYQLSIAISDALLREIASEIRNSNLIELVK